jgi:hypothetical protein
MSLLKIAQMQASGNNMLVSFPTSGSWTTVLTNGVPQNNVAGTGGTVQITDTNGAAQSKRCYRVVVQ